MTAPDATDAHEPAVQRDILGQVVDPPGAEHSTLSVVRYTIPAGAELHAHIHPGVQVARIEEGELTYTIEFGAATIRRAAADADEQVAGPATITLGPGDTVTEFATMVHFGANQTDRPLVIIATLLTADGEGLAVEVDEPEG